MEVKFQKLSPYDDRSLPDGMANNIMNVTNHVAKSGHYLKGDVVHVFEENFGKYITPDRSRETVAVGNGFDALVISMLALGIRMNDRVLVPYNAPLPVWMAVSTIGAIPIGVDPDEKSYNITASKLEEICGHLTEQPVAVIVVHMYGFPAFMEDIVQYCNRKGIFVIEDCSHAHGASLGDVRVGNFGNIAAFSFYPTKNLGAMGDAGAVHCPKYLSDRVRKMREYGGGDTIGRNSRMDEIQAAVLSRKLSCLDVSNDHRISYAKAYSTSFARIPAITTPPAILKAHQVYHQYVIQVPRGARDGLRTYLAGMGIETAIHYQTYPFMMQFYSSPYNWSSVVARMAETLLSLPIAPHLTAQELSYVVYHVAEYFS